MADKIDFDIEKISECYLLTLWRTLNLISRL